VDAWIGAEGRLDGRVKLLRFRPELRAFLGDDRYARRLQVTWSYVDDGSSGMPSAGESDAMRALEDRLVAALESARAGTLAFVTTYSGSRDWHFYVSAATDLGSLVNEALCDLPAAPIELQIEDDPQWAELANILDSVRS
jgi:hypothetical protein